MNLKKPNILVVEDNRVNALVVQNFLKKLGLDSEWVVDGLKALIRIQNNPNIDLIFMDLSMPLMDGFEATLKIREFEQAQQLPKTLIIALTAHASRCEIERCFEVGMQAHLSKPILIEVIAHTLEVVCGYSVAKNGFLH